MRRIVLLGFLLVSTFPAALSAGESKMTLGRAWELMQDFDPALKASAHLVEERRGDKVSATAPFLPHIAANAEIRRYIKEEGFIWDSGNMGLGVLPFPATEKTVPAYSVGMEQLIFDSGKSVARYRQARSEVEAAVLSDAAYVQERAVLLVEAFSQLYLARERLAVARSAAEAYSEHERVARAMYSQNQVPHTDLLTAEVSASKAKLDVKKAEDGVATASDGLVSLIGERPRDVAAPRVSPPPKDADAERPEILAKEAQMRAARHEAKKEGLSYLPEVYARAEASYVDDDYRINKDQFTFRGGVRWPIFDGRQKWGQRRSAIARAQRISYERQAMERSFAVEREDASRAYARSEEEISVAQRNRDRASANLRDVRAAYREGVATALEVRDAVRLWSEAAYGYHEALCMRELSAAKLRQAAGAAVFESGGIR